MGRGGVVDDEREELVLCDGILVLRKVRWSGGMENWPL